MTTTIYHNPRCSKSRATLALLRENGVEPEIVRYLETPPDARTLKDLTELLGCSIRDMMRTGEDLYRQLGLKDRALSEQALIDIVAAHPRLLERPIVVKGRRAALGRPPHNVLSIL